MRAGRSSAAPSSRNWTPATPTLSVALALTLTVPDTVAPAAGAVMATVGAVVSVMVMLTGADVAVAPRLSVATAVSAYVPGEPTPQLSE